MSIRIIKAINDVSSGALTASRELDKLKSLTRDIVCNANRSKGRKPSGLKKASNLPMYDAIKEPELDDTVFGQTVIGYKRVSSKDKYLYYHVKTRDSIYQYNYLLRVARDGE